MLFEEFTNPIMSERRDSEEKSSPDSEAPEPKAGYSDPELARTLDRVAVAYPYYKRGNEAFMKYTQRALKHSEESAQEQSAQIADLNREIEDIKQVIARLQQK